MWVVGHTIPAIVALLCPARVVTWLLELIFAEPSTLWLTTDPCGDHNQEQVGFGFPSRIHIPWKHAHTFVAMIFVWA